MLDYHLRQRELIIRLKKKMRDYSDRRGITEYGKWHDSCIETINQAYPDPRERHEYRLWHAFIGGTGYQDLPNFDFHGEFSIQKMIEKLP